MVMMLPILSKRSVTAVWSLLGVCLLLAATGAQAAPGGTEKRPIPKFSEAKAFDVSQPLHRLAAAPSLRSEPQSGPPQLFEIRRERGQIATDQGFAGDGAVQGSSELQLATSSAAAIQAPLANFDGISNQDNFNLFGFRVNRRIRSATSGRTTTSRW